MLVGGASVLYVGAVFDIVQLASTGTADVTFAWLAATRITHGVFNWAIAKKVPWLMVTRSEIGEPGEAAVPTLLQILHT
jgi:hypothetical protein